MADLDDFFAKKDRKKTTKKKVATSDDIGKLLDDPNKQAEKPRKEKEKTIASVVNVSKLVDQDDSEWKENDEERDYSGLKVQNLTMKDKEEEFREQKALEVEQESKQNEAGGPWRGPKPEDEESDKSTEDLYTPAPPVEKAAPMKYVPPGQRNQQSQSAGPKPRSGRAPELDNKEEFPSLGDAPPPELGKDFVAVKHGAHLGVKTAVNNTVPTDNKYKALSGGRDFSN